MQNVSSGRERYVRSVVVAASLVGGAGVAAAQNLLQNGGFESGLASWEAQSGARVIQVIGGAREGAHVLELDIPTDQLPGFLTQALALEPDREYRLSYWHQRSFAEGGMRLPVTLDGFTTYNVISRPIFWSFTPDQSQPSTPYWYSQSVRFFATRSDSTIQFGPVTDNVLTPPIGGKVWVDDVVLTPLSTFRQTGIDHDFVPVLPSEAVVGQPIELRISCIDVREPQGGFAVKKTPVRTTKSFGMTVDDTTAVYSSPVRFAGETNRSVPITFNTPGVHRVTLNHPNGHQRTSNPVRVTAAAPELRHFWGDIHIHAEFTDAGWVGGNGFDNYWFARDVASLDFAALSEHYGFFMGPNLLGRIAAATRVYDAPGRFVTIQGVETASGQGHHNYYLRGDDRYDMFNPLNFFADEQGKLEYFRSQGTPVLGIPHHTALLDPTDWRVTDSAACTVVEVYSNHGSSEVAGQWWRHPAQRGADYSATMGVRGHDFLTALQRGQKVGVIACSDDHLGRPGFEGLTCVPTPELQRQAVWDAIQSRRCYGTSGARTLVDFSIAGEPMGGELFLTPGTPLSADVRVNATASITKLEIVSNGAVVATLAPGVRDWVDPALGLGRFDGTPRWFYLRIEQQDGHRAWTSPIWVSPAALPDLVLERRDLEFDHATNVLTVRPQNHGDAPVTTTVRVFSSAGNAAITDFDAAGDFLAVVTEVEPQSSTRSLLRVSLYNPYDFGQAFQFSGTIQIANHGGYSIVTDPRGMLVDDHAGTIGWNDGPYGFRAAAGGLSYTGQYTDFAVLVNTTSGTTVDCTFRRNGSPITVVYKGDQFSGVAGGAHYDLGLVASQTAAAGKLVVVPAHGSATVQFPFLPPGVTYVVSLDGTNLVAESDESNNSWPIAVPLEPIEYVPWPIPSHPGTRPTSR